LRDLTPRNAPPGILVAPLGSHTKFGRSDPRASILISNTGGTLSTGFHLAVGLRHCAFAALAVSTDLAGWTPNVHRSGTAVCFRAAPVRGCPDADAAGRCTAGTFTGRAGGAGGSGRAAGLDLLRVGARSVSAAFLHAVSILAAALAFGTGGSPGRDACRPSIAAIRPAAPPAAASPARAPAFPAPFGAHPGEHHPLHIPPHRIARNPESLHHLTYRRALHQHLMSHNVYLVHPQHPPAESPATMAGKFPHCGVDQFQSGGITPRLLARRGLSRLDDRREAEVERSGQRGKSDADAAGDGEALESCPGPEGRVERRFEGGWHPPLDLHLKRRRVSILPRHLGKRAL
jgi:hypothetical protein